MSVNSINNFGGVQYGGLKVDPIKLETRQKLKELGIDVQSVQTEAQAQKKISNKEEQMRKEMREHLQAQAGSLSQSVQSVNQVQQPQQVNGVESVDGIKESQQVRPDQPVDKMNSVNNQQQGDEQTKAMAANNQVIQNLPFEKGSELVAMYNKFKLGLI